MWWCKGTSSTSYHHLLYSSWARTLYSHMARVEHARWSQWYTSNKCLCCWWWHCSSFASDLIPVTYTRSSSKKVKKGFNSETHGFKNSHACLSLNAQLFPASYAEENNNGRHLIGVKGHAHAARRFKWFRAAAERLSPLFLVRCVVPILNFGVPRYRLLTRTHTHAVFLRVEVTLKFESLSIFSLL